MTRASPDSGLLPGSRRPGRSVSRHAGRLRRGRGSRLTVHETGPAGSIIYERSQSTPSGIYNPPHHTVYVGAHNAARESGSYAGAIYRNLLFFR